jgi:hypothetical protein
MASIIVHMKDGTIKRWVGEGRAGGSWTNSIQYKETYVIIEDLWGVKTALPIEDIKEIIERPSR